MHIALQPDLFTRRQLMHENSIGCYYGQLPTLSRRARRIYQFLTNIHIPLTDRAIMLALSYADMNAVRPRISEMVKRGLLKETGSTVCKVTRKKVRLVEIAH